MHPLILEKPAHGCVIESIGLRSYMEDRKLIIEYNDGVILYAVMDGHGGTDVVDYVTKLLPEIFQRILTENKDIRISIFNEFLRLDKDIFDKKLRSGTTLTAVLRIQNILYFINVGDSRSVLVKNGKVIFETVDHKPGDKFEKLRIEKAGGFVGNTDTDRVDNLLAVSRAFGDNYLKNDKDGNYRGFSAKVSAEPSITRIDLASDKISDSFYKYNLILASDGFWDSMTSENTATRIQDSTCRTLMSESINSDEYNGDNITIMTDILMKDKIHNLFPVTVKDEIENTRVKMKLYYYLVGVVVFIFVLLVSFINKYF